MWQNIKYYVIALVIIVIATLVSTGLQLLEGSFPVGHPASTLAANLSGVTIGGFIMVIGFLRDSRLDEERKRTQEALQYAESQRQRAEAAEAQILQERERAEAERERIDRHVEEMVRIGQSYANAAEMLNQRLRELDNGHELSSEG